MYSIRFNENSSADDRRQVYKTAWGLGLRRRSRKKSTGYACAFIARKDDLKTELIEQLFETSPAVQGWEKAPEW
jgi:hypothetical protein